MRGYDRHIGEFRFSPRGRRLARHEFANARHNSLFHRQDLAIHVAPEDSLLERCRPDVLLVFHGLLGVSASNRSRDSGPLIKRCLVAHVYHLGCACVKSSVTRKQSGGYGFCYRPGPNMARVGVILARQATSANGVHKRLDVPSSKSSLEVAFVSTFPPRRCGIATYTADLVSAVEVAAPGLTSRRAIIDEHESRLPYRGQIVCRIRQGDAQSYVRAARALNASTVNVVNLQHEFALYGEWRDSTTGWTFSDHLRPMLELLEKPLVSTLHSVPPSPHPSVRDAIRALAELSDRVVVMAASAQPILAAEYGIQSETVVIPHGMPDISMEAKSNFKAMLGIEERTLISTFGLVDPRKGLEFMIQAMPAVMQAHPEVLYLVAGQTHPDLIRREGERYRATLVDIVRRLDLGDNVAFLDEYMTQQEIIDLLVATDVYVTPYLDPLQITSGTLAYALGAGRAIVSTKYLHAQEALADGRGIQVGFRDSDALAAAINSVMDNPILRRDLEHRAYTYARSMTWPRAGERWVELMGQVVAKPRRARGALV